MPPSDKTALQCVIEVDQERIRLEKEAELLATKDDVGKIFYAQLKLALNKLK